MIYKRILILLASISLPGSGFSQEPQPVSDGEDERISVLDQVVPVADEPPAPETAADSDAERVGPPTGDPETSGLTEREILALEFGRFQRLKADGMLDEAENAAKRAIEMSINISGPSSNDTAKALNNLATVQYSQKKYELAQQNFQAAIDIFTDNEDKLSARLINPLKGLGAAQLEGGRPDLAAKTFRQATHITHVNEGPHNLDQISILEALAETNLRLGEFEQARNAQDMIYALNLRHLDDDPMSLIPPLRRRAAWQRRTGYVLDERATYRRMIRIIEEAKGKDDISLIDPITRLAESYFYTDASEPNAFQEASIANGEIYFKRAVRIAEENPESSWEILANALVALGDYYNFRSDQGRARRTYSEVWDLLSADEERFAMRSETLGKLHALNAEPIPSYRDDTTREDGSNLDRDLREGSVVIAYDVSSRGRVTKVEVIENIPAEFDDMAKKVVREVRRRVYRPPFVDGEPAESPNQVMTHKYFFNQLELDKVRASLEDEQD